MVFVSFLCSCKKEKVEDLPAPSLPATKAKIRKDSISYTVDGILYTSNGFERGVFGSGRGNEIVFSNMLTGIENADSSIYFTTQTFGYRDDNPDYKNSRYFSFQIQFNRKYGKKQLFPKEAEFTNYPVNEIDLYKLGEHPYAERAEAKDGIEIMISSRNFGQDFFGTSFMPFSETNHTSIGQQPQENSKFNVISLDTLVNGEIIMEATFNVNIFDRDRAKLLKVEDGFLRIPVFLYSKE